MGDTDTGWESDLARATRDMGDARERLLTIVARLSDDDFSRGGTGGWAVGRVLLHLIESEAIYAKLMAHMTGGNASEAAVAEPEDADAAATLLVGTRASVLGAVAAADSESLYRLTKFGHEEFSPLSLIENIASHERDHADQIAELAAEAQADEAVAPTMAWSPPRRGAIDPGAQMIIRAAVLDDLPRLVEIYNHYIVHTAITFDLERLTVEKRRPWFERYAATGRYRLLVAEIDGTVVGYTASSAFAAKQAYETTVETTIICAAEAVGRGVGERLYTALFEALQHEDVHLAMALITMPNRGSAALHERFGFTRAALIREVGRKFGRYWDVAWYQKPMRGG